MDAHPGFSFCYGDEENGCCACTYENLTTANQSEIRGSVSRLCYGDEENGRCACNRINILTTDLSIEKITFGKNAQKNKFLHKRRMIFNFKVSSYPHFFARKYWKNGLMNGIINFIHRKTEKNTYFGKKKKNGCFVNF